MQSTVNYIIHVKWTFNKWLPAIRPNKCLSSIPCNNKIKEHSGKKLAQLKFKHCWKKEASNWDKTINNQNIV